MEQSLFVINQKLGEIALTTESPSPLEALPEDIILRIFSKTFSIGAFELCAMSLTSKNCKLITSKAPFYINLCKKAKLDFLGLLPRDVFITKFLEGDELTLCVSDFYNAKLGFNKSLNEIENSLVFLRFEALSKDPCASDQLRAAACYYTAEMRVWNRTNLITDDVAFDLLKEVSENFYVSNRKRAKAKCVMAYLCKEKRTTKISLDAAAKMFHSVMNNPDSPLRYRQSAIRAYAEMNLARIVKQITQHEAVGLWKMISEDPQLPIAEQVDAEAIVALGNFYDTSEESCDEKLAVQFQSLLKNRYLVKYNVDQIAAHLAIMRVENRTDRINDSQAAQMLSNAAETRTLFEKLRDSALYNLAVMCYENRSNIISDLRVNNIFLSRANDPNRRNIDRAEAFLYMARMCCENRNDIMQDSEAISFLQQAKLIAPKRIEIVEMADFYLANMRVQNRG